MLMPPPTLRLSPQQPAPCPRPPRARTASGLCTALFAALGAACAPSAAEVCQSLADKQAHCEYQVADDAVARCISRLAQVPTACRTSMVALGQCVVGADCDMSEDDCRPQTARYHADCADPNAFGRDF